MSSKERKQKTEKGHMAESKKAKGGKKNRKHGRHAVWCNAYRNRNQRERNKARRLRKHIATFPKDKCPDTCALEALSRYQLVLRGRIAA